MSDDKTPIQSDGWKQWSKSVKESLEKLEKKVDKLEDKITIHREESLVEVSTLKAKAGIMGMITGFVVSTVMSLIIGILVWQLTVGNHPIYQPSNYDIPFKPDGAVGYVLPPRDDGDDFFVVKEAKT